MRLIDADRLLTACRAVRGAAWSRKAAPVSWETAYESFEDDVEQQPEADPVRHAHWINEDGLWDDRMYMCSACRAEWCLEAGTPADNDMRYCPVCGARMDEEAEDDGAGGAE